MECFRNLLCRRSGGNQGKVYQAQWITRNYEPTNLGVWLYIGVAEVEETAGIFVFKLANTTAYYYDIDTKYEIAVPAQFVEGRILVPLREVSTSIGITDLEYEASTGKITFTSFDGYTVEMTMASTTATLTKDGTTVKYDASGYVVVSAGEIADENINTYIEAYNK